MVAGPAEVWRIEVSAGVAGPAAVWNKNRGFGWCGGADGGVAYVAFVSAGGEGGGVAYRRFGQRKRWKFCKYIFAVVEGTADVLRVLREEGFLRQHVGECVREVADKCAV